MRATSFTAPRAIGALMAGFPHRWAICGGWALDLYLGRVSRAHKDVDIAVLRRDQATVRAWLAARGWTLEKAHDGRLSPWDEGEMIELPVHGIWCRNPRHDPDFLEVLLNEADGTHFRFRRDPAITLDLDRAFLHTDTGVPVLAPEITLLYKAKHAALAENAADFRTALPHLDRGRRAWLRDSLERVHPGHEWLRALYRLLP